MALRELSQEQIRESLEFIRELLDMPVEETDGSDYLMFQNEVSILETHTGMPLHKLLEDYNV